MNREDEVQVLLRNAFACTQRTKGCNCPERIQKFLHEDRVSKEWAKRKKEENLCPKRDSIV